MIDKNDTVLVRTRETIVVSPRLSGAFYSKVKVVSQGFGHVSTTLDPEWEGQLLISLNNPTNKKIKFSIEKNVYGNNVYNSFVTVEFSFLRTPATMQADNMAGRLDILDETIEKNVSIFKRKEIEKFRELVEKLHECDEKKINEMVLDELDENEQAEWKDVLLEKEKDVRLRSSNTFRIVLFCISNAKLSFILIHSFNNMIYYFPYYRNHQIYYNNRCHTKCKLVFRP